jgi:hypothetical protein
VFAGLCLMLVLLPISQATDLFALKTFIKGKILMPEPEEQR